MYSFLAVNSYDAGGCPLLIAIMSWSLSIYPELSENLGSDLMLNKIEGGFF
jgi:hypothetical protein